MAYYINLFSPETYESFTKSDQSISGFRVRQENAASRIKVGDKLICLPPPPAARETGNANGRTNPRSPGKAVSAGSLSTLPHCGALDQSLFDILTAVRRAIHVPKGAVIDGQALP